MNRIALQPSLRERRKKRGNRGHSFPHLTKKDLFFFQLSFSLQAQYKSLLGYTTKFSTLNEDANLEEHLGE